MPVLSCPPTSTPTTNSQNKPSNQNHKNPKPPKILLNKHTETPSFKSKFIATRTRPLDHPSSPNFPSQLKSTSEIMYLFPNPPYPKSSKTNRHLQFQIKWLVYSSNLRLSSSQNQKPQIKHTRTNWSLDHHHPSFSKTLHVGGSDEKIWSQPLVHTQSAVCCWFVKK